jgi:hypothetical protein
MKGMRHRKINTAVILAFYGCFLNCFVQANQTTQTGTPIPWASRSVALSALESNREVHLASLDPKLGTEGIVVYRVVVNADGSILRREKIKGDPDLQALAEPFVSSWHFKSVSISGSPSSWWSYVGVCFFRNAGKMIPCDLPQGEPTDKTEETVPSRLLLVGNAEGNHYDFPPMQKTKGASLQRSELARVGRITGEVTVDLVIAPDGAVSQATRIVGHPLLLDATVEAVRGWRFAPVTFLGNSLEVQLRLKVRYGLND